MKKKFSKAEAARVREELRRIDRFDLRGLSHQPMTRQRGLKGSKFGAAGPCKRINPETGEVIAILK